MVERFADDAELVHLYSNEQLPLAAIASRFRVTKQGVHYRLVRAGVKMRPRSTKRDGRVDLDKLRHLLLDRGLSLPEAAKEMNESVYAVTLAAHALGIRGKKYRCRIFPALNSISVGESITVTSTGSLQDERKRFSGFAQKLDIRLSIEFIDDKTVRITRVE